MIKNFVVSLDIEVNQSIKHIGISYQNTQTLLSADISV